MRRFILLALAIPFLVPCGAWASPASEKADIANSLYQQGCYDTAVMFYEKALRLNPGYGPAISGRAAALRKMAHPNSPEPKVAKAKKPKKTEEKPRNADAIARAQAAAAAKKAQTAAAKPKPAVVAVLAPPKPKPAVAVVAPPKPKPIAAVKPVEKPPVAAQAAKPKPTVAVTAPKPKPVVAITQPSTDAIFTPVNPPQPVAAIKPVASVPLASMTKPVPHETPVPHVSVPPVDHSSVAVPANVGSAPPMSSLSESGARSAIDEKVPGWLIGMAVGTFLLLIVLAIWWLSPTLSASRQLHDRLKGLERTREER